MPHRLPRLRTRQWVWIALCVLIAAACVPALAAAAHAWQGIAPRAGVCSAASAHRDGERGDSGAPGSKAHCPLCLLQDYPPPLSGAIDVSVESPPLATTLRPRQVERARGPAHTWSPLVARGPPLPARLLRENATRNLPFSG
ncbi:DUF2946 family protein [Aquabacterium sp.]|uniref:DUF2946 family protein n=1 Tax=Aquabacterium sp. TaxID=1872578 RepID=UPI0035B39EF6